jgi:hypothetical protein
MSMMRGELMVGSDDGDEYDGRVPRPVASGGVERTMMITT